MINRNTAIAGSPVLIGGITVLVVVVAVFLAYNANAGLPFVPTLDVKLHTRDGANLTKGSEVKEGGFRVGFVRRLKPVTLPDGKAGAEISLQLDGGMDLPPDTRFTIRPRSPLGLKYLEVERGSAASEVEPGHTFPAAQVHIPVQVDEVNEQFDEPTRDAVRMVTRNMGDALAVRGISINETIARLPRFLPLAERVARNLADPRTELGRFFRELGDAARVVRPVADVQADLFTRTAQTFEALSRDPRALQETISRTHPAFRAGIRSFPVQRPFLTESARLAADMRPFVARLRPTLPGASRALRAGIPVTRRSAAFYDQTRLTLAELREVVEDPATGLALRALLDNVSTLKPILRFLGPYQTVCNYWNYWWTYLGEYQSEENKYGFSQRVLLRSMPQQNNSPASLGAAEPANGEGFQEATRRRGDPVHFHGQVYSAAITEDGEADCENGQRGYMRRLSKFLEPKFLAVTDHNNPGVQGPTYKGRPRVLPGQTFSRLPETGAQHP